MPLSVILSVTLTIPLFSLDTAFAVPHPVSSRLIYLDPIPGVGQTSIEDTNEMAQEAMSEPSYYDEIDFNRPHPWPVLRDRDHLNPGEIHLRVQMINLKPETDLTFSMAVTATTQSKAAKTWTSCMAETEMIHCSDATA